MNEFASDFGPEEYDDFRRAPIDPATNERSTTLAEAPMVDLDAEYAVLCAVIERPEARTEVRGAIAPSHFSSFANQTIYRAILALESEGHAVDRVTIARHLHDAGRLDQIGGTNSLTRLIDATPHVEHVAEYARIVRVLAQKRRTKAALEQSLVELKRGAEVSEIVARVAQVGAESPQVPRLQTIGVAEIFDALPPVPYLLRELDICPGAPTLFAGLGFSGKTLLAHALGLAVACGAPAWGSLTTRPGKVLVLDYEQGEHLTRRRIQRMARGMGLIPEGDSLRLASMPALYADDPEAEAELRAACQGVALCVIDSLSAACPSLEENSASARRTLDMLGRVSEATGCVIIVIHHGKKPGKDDTGGARNSIRGSSALFDAAGCVVVFERSPNGTIALKHEKARTSGTLAKPMVATIIDTDDGGLSVTVTASRESSASGSGARKLEELKEQIRALFREHGDQSSKGAVRERLGCSRDLLFAAFGELEHVGEIVNVGTQKRPVLRLVEVAQ